MYQPLRRIRPLGWAGIGLACVSLVAAGCSGKGVTAQGDPAKHHIQLLFILYGKYSSTHGGKGPPDEKAFKDWIQKADAGLLGPEVNKEKIDDLFVSPRDHEPYVIAYGTSAGAPTPGQKSTAVIYEKTGMGGKHYVVSGAAKVDEVDENELRQMLPQQAGSS